MRIYIHELSSNDTELHFDHTLAWVMSAITAADEKTDGDPVKPGTVGAGADRNFRAADVDFSLRRLDDLIVVDGRIKTALRLLCSRCGDPFAHPCDKKFSSLFSQDPVTAGVAHKDEEHEGRIAGQNHGKALQSAHLAREERDLADLSTDHDLDITYLSQDFIDLGEILTEQLLLQVPFQPLCSPDCKGVCLNCGADLNRGRCACSRVMKSGPFAVLKNWASTEVKAPLGGSSRRKSETPETGEN